MRLRGLRPPTSTPSGARSPVGPRVAVLSRTGWDGEVMKRIVDRDAVEKIDWSRGQSAFYSQMDRVEEEAFEKEWYDRWEAWEEHPS